MYRPFLLVGASALSLLSTVAYAQDTGAPPVEIIVTGTQIQRSNYQPTSPVDIVGREDLEAKAPATIAEFVKDLPYNTGSSFASGRAFGNERGAGTINLRGLGASATLVLINGRRQTQLPDAEDAIVDVNSLSRYYLSPNGTVGVALINELNFALDGLGGANCNRTQFTPGQSDCEYFNLFWRKSMHGIQLT